MAEVLNVAVCRHPLLSRNNFLFINAEISQSCHSPLPQMHENINVGQRFTSIKKNIYKITVINRYSKQIKEIRTVMANKT